MESNQRPKCKFSHLWSAFILTKKPKSYNGEQKTSIQKNPILSLCTKVKSKYIKYLNINPVTLNLIKRKYEFALKALVPEGNFLNSTNVAQTLKMIINKWNIMRWKSFCKAKETIKRIKEKPTEKENIFSSPASYREQISKLLKEPNNRDIKKP